MVKYKYLNLNPKGIREEDCVTRAITFASGLPYKEIYEKLWLTARIFNCDRLCKFCYSNFINYVLKYKEVNCDNLTIRQFAEKHPYGTYLIRINGHFNGHLTCIRDSVLYDIWDCRDELCDTVWKADDI